MSMPLRSLVNVVLSCLLGYAIYEFRGRFFYLVSGDLYWVLAGAAWLFFTFYILDWFE